MHQYLPENSLPALLSRVLSPETKDLRDWRTSCTSERDSVG